MYPCPQNGQRKRLCDIVIRTTFKPCDNINFQIIRRQKYDGNVTALSDLTTQIQSASIRKVDIQNY